MTNRHFISFAVAIGALLFGVVQHSVAAQTPSSNIRELVRQADFAGFVEASPGASGTAGEWRQGVLISAVENIESKLPRHPAILSDHFPPSSYPTWFPEAGKYLVFLKREIRDGREIWQTLAAFRVYYSPDPRGKIVGAVFGGITDRESIRETDVRTLLKQVASGDASEPDTRSLDNALRRATAAAAAPEFRKTPSYEARLAEAQGLAAAIRVGTSRTDVEKIFRVKNGGLTVLNGPFPTSYYFGSEVTVDVPYEHPDATWSGGDKVSGPIKVYRGFQIFD
jgi:hypothetical protein